MPTACPSSASRGDLVELIRNTPILVQIFLIAYGLRGCPRRFSSILHGRLLALVLWGGAFNTENFRAGFERCLRAIGSCVRARLRSDEGVSECLAADRRPNRASLVDQHLISVFKNTALMVAISVEELTNVAKQSIDLDFRTWEMIFVLAVTY